MGIFSKGSGSKSAADTVSADQTLASTILQTSLVDAQLLMMTAAERGIELEEDVTKAILEASDALDKKLLTPENTASFWQAYDRLSRSLSPITIDSVRATHDMRRLRAGIWGYLQGRTYVPFSRKSAFRYKLLSLTTLLVLIALQVFSAIGNTLVVDIKEQSDRIIELKKQLFDDSTPLSTNGTADTVAHTPDNVDGLAPDTDNDEQSNKETSPNTGNFQIINQKIDEYISWRNAEIIGLKNWNRFWGRIMFFSKQTWEKPEYNDLSPESKLHVHYVSAQYVLHAISVYFLPMLYGLLGATFYVLRQLPKDIENLTFSMNSHIEYSLRAAQGPLAGIMASFFFSEAPNKLYALTTHTSAFATIKLGSSSLSDFSPLAIAFLAGYSVELIFYVIDKIIATVTTKSTTAGVKHAPAPKPSASKTTAHKTDDPATRSI
jgi:hypothetical protein